MLNLVRKYQTGGDLLDTSAMLANVKNDSRNVRKDGSTTRRGRNELEAIRQIEENQKAGRRYIIDHEANTFKLVDKNGQDVDGGLGHGLSTKEDDFTVFRKAKIRKEISERMGEYSNYVKKEEPKVETPPAVAKEKEPVVASESQTKPKSEVVSTARKQISNKSNTTKSTTTKEEPVSTGKTAGEYSHVGNPGATYSKNGNNEWLITPEGSNVLTKITDPKRIAELEKNAKVLTAEATKSKKEPAKELPKTEATETKSEVKKREFQPSPPVSSTPVNADGQKRPPVKEKKKKSVAPVISDAEAARLEAKMAAQEKKDNQDYLDKQAAEAQKSIEESNKDAEALLKQNKRTGAAASMYNAREKISAQKKAEQEKRKKEDEAIKKDKEEYLNSGSAADKKAKHERSLKTPVVETMERNKTEIEKEAGKIKTVRTALSRINTMSSTDKKKLAGANIDMLKILAKKYNVKYEAGGRIPKFQAGTYDVLLPNNYNSSLAYIGDKKLDAGEGVLSVNDYPGFVQSEQERLRKKALRDTTAGGNKTNVPAKDYSNAASLALDALGTYTAWKAMKEPVVTVDAPVMKAIQGPVNSVLAEQAIYTDKDKKDAQGYARHNANADPGLDMIAQLLERSRKNAAMGEILAKSNAFKLAEKTRVNNETNAVAGQQAYNRAQFDTTLNENKKSKYAADIERAGALAERATNIAKLKTDFIGGLSKNIAGQGTLNTDARLKLLAKESEKLESDYKKAYSKYQTVQTYPDSYTEQQILEAETDYTNAKEAYDNQSTADPVSEANAVARPLLNSARSIISKLINR